MQQPGTFSDLLLEITTRRLFILSHGALWSPNTHVPMSIRQAIKKHRHELKRMIADGDIRLCPARDLHRHSWRYAGNGCYQCGMCLQLAAC